MTVECNQILLRVSDLAQARTFYVDQLGLEVIEEFPKMIAVRAGVIRFSIFGGGKKKGPSDEDPPASVMLRVSSIDKAVEEITARGVVFEGEVMTAPGFMRYVSLLDPDGNELYVAEYMKDPLA